jgi:glucose/arabinose dehydrogenase
MMKKLIAFVPMFTGLLITVGCANKNGNSQLVNPADSAASVETNKPNTDYTPAFVGQTRVKAVKTTTAYEVVSLADGIGRPWALEPLPDGRLLLTEKSGYMEIRDAQGKLQTKVTGFPAVDDRGQGGLLDVVPDPEFTQNKIIYWAYSEKYGSGNLTAIAKGKLSADEKSIENPTVIIRATPALSSNLHFGCRLLFDKDGYLYATVGERSIMEGRKQAQWLNAGLGKIFRLTGDGKAAPGNPFASTANAMPEIWSYGHRNPQSLAIHPATGELWEAEFGPRGGDELNLIKPGKNYGWPVITYGIEYGGGQVGEGITKKDGLEQPVYYWDPVISPSGMCFYEGNAIPEWRNNLFIACLSGLHVARLVIENNKVVGEERLLTDQTERFRDIACADGKLYVVTDSGKLLLIKKK